ncbi:Abi family protein [Carnobacterium maltaromaticum]|uniref:Abi family protein n=1 Tax=Carnobacterium maltaromaticum TaxID=2751 RepID=UPI0039BDF83D
MTEYTKPAATYKEQLDILKSRNLIVDDEDKAIKYLKSVGYFRLNGYWLTLCSDKDTFCNNTTFEHIIDIYNFDYKLKVIIFDLLEIVEVNLRALISHHFAISKNPLSHYDVNNFVNKKWYSSWIEEFETQVAKAKIRKEPFVSHYVNKYDSIFPIWAALEMTSFGTLSKFYNNLDNVLKNEISKSNYSLQFEYLANYIYVFSVVRNMCAHNCRLYDRQLAIIPKLSRKEAPLMNNKYIYSVIYCAGKIITDIEKWEDQKKEIKNLVIQFQGKVDLEKVGFPNDWESLLDSVN